MALARDRGELYSHWWLDGALVSWSFYFLYNFLLLKYKFIYETKFRKIQKKIVFDTPISKF